MTVYFLRHGDADWPDWLPPDDERPLNEKGKKKMRRVAKFLADMDIQPAVILSSPLPRAMQTAEIAAEALGLKVTAKIALSPGFDEKRPTAILSNYKGQNVLLVGHEPDFSSMIEKLTGDHIKMAKAGCARVDMDETGLRGQLVWLIPPKTLA